MTQKLDVEQKPKLLNVAPKAHEAPVVRVEKNESIVMIDKMKFQVFDGDMKKYPEFRAEFIKHVQPQCTESQQAYVLKQHLSEAVRDEVSNVSDDYEQMWQRLNQRSWR